MSKNQLARGIWAGFAPTEDPFAIPNGMEANLRLIDDHIALYTLASPVLSTAALPVPANQGAGQIFRDGSYAVFNAGTWELYPARTGLVAIELSSRTTYINTGALWEVVVPHNWKAYLLKSELLADAAPNGTVGIVTNDPADTDLNHVNGMYVRSGNAWIYSLLQFVERRDLAALAFSGKADDIQETESHKVLSAGERTKIQMLVDEVADARAQFAELTIQLHQQAIALLLGRIQKLESLSQDIQMTAYALAHTANVAASTLVASGSIQRLQVLNRSSDARVGIAFGAPPVSMNDAGLLVLEPGAALDTDLIPSTPIYAIADSEAQLSGAFAVPLNEPNPNWETDFATLMTGMGSDPGGVWTTAYRRLYSALRRDGILARSRGLYVFAAHSDQAARQNWAAPGSYAVAIGAPVFTAKTGFVYNGSADYHDTQLAMGGASDQNPYTTTKDISAMVWPGTEDQPTGATALGDNVISVETNRSPTQAALRTGTTNGDVVAIPALGTPLGFVRVADDRATAYVAGSNSATIVRARLTGYTQRLMYIGANNTSAGAASFYAGTIRAAQFGKSLNSVQMLAMNAAMQRFFAAIKGA